MSTPIEYSSFLLAYWSQWRKVNEQALKDKDALLANFRALIEEPKA